MTEHCGLHRGHQLARFDAERGEAENLVAVFRDEDLHKAAWFRHGLGAQYFGHRQFRESIVDARTARLHLVLSHSRELGIGEHTERDQAPSLGSVLAVQVGIHD